MSSYVITLHITRYFTVIYTAITLLSRTKWMSRRGNPEAEE